MTLAISIGWGRGAASDDDDNAQHSRAARRTGGGDEHVPWVTVLETFDRIEAVIIQSKLHDAGIPARLRQEGANSAFPVTVGILGRIEVRVPETVEEQAFDLVKAHFDADPIPPETDHPDED